MSGSRIFKVQGLKYKMMWLDKSHIGISQTEEQTIEVRWIDDATMQLMMKWSWLSAPPYTV